MQASPIGTFRQLLHLSVVTAVLGNGIHTAVCGVYAVCRLSVVLFLAVRYMYAVSPGAGSAIAQTALLLVAMTGAWRANPVASCCYSCSFSYALFAYAKCSHRATILPYVVCCVSTLACIKPGLCCLMLVQLPL